MPGTETGTVNAHDQSEDDRASTNTKTDNHITTVNPDNYLLPRHRVRGTHCLTLEDSSNSAVRVFHNK